MSPTVFCPEGALTVDTVGVLLRQLLPGIADGSVQTLDLGCASHADSAALALILSARRAAHQAGRPLVLRGVSEELTALADLYGVAELIAPANLPASA
jgi:phospholipid transport system transporter-binding protein